MTSDWKLIGSGFVIAGIGAVATMLYIVGISGLYIGRYAAGVMALGCAGALALIFYRYLGRFLDTLDLRAGNAGDDDEPNP
jgi:hypothetical protein